MLEIIVSCVCVVIAILYFIFSKEIGLTNVEREKIKELFRLIDADENGILDVKELKVLFASEVNLTQSPPVDTGKGISMEEFAEYFADLKERQGNKCLTSVLSTWLSPGHWARVWTKTAEKAVLKKQKALGLNENAVSKEQREFLRSVFTSLDVDGNGFLDIAEMMDCNVSRKQVAGVFLAMDASDKGSVDGKVSLDEFMSYWESLCGTVAWKDVQTAAGELLQKKLKLTREVDYSVDKTALIAEMGESWDRKARRVFAEIDTDHDHKLTKKEFKEWAEKNQKAAELLIPGLDLAEGFEEMVADFDDDMNWTLDVDEFSKAYQYKMATSMLKSD